MWKMMMSTTIEKVRMDDDCHNIGIAPSFGITLWAFLEKCNSYRFGDCVGQSQGNYKIPYRQVIFLIAENIDLKF